MAKPLSKATPVKPFPQTQLLAHVSFLPTLSSPPHFQPLGTEQRIQQSFSPNTLPSSSSRIERNQARFQAVWSWFYAFLLSESGDVTCKETIPIEAEVEARFLAKEDGIVVGIALAEMVFNEVDPSLKVEWHRKDGDSVHKGLQFGKVQGRVHSIVVAARVVLNFM